MDDETRRLLKSYPNCAHLKLDFERCRNVEIIEEKEQDKKRCYFKFDHNNPEEIILVNPDKVDALAINANDLYVNYMGMFYIQDIMKTFLGPETDEDLIDLMKT